MTVPPPPSSSGFSRPVQGASWIVEDAAELAAAVEAAFDYRGDVTILLREGEEVKGYVSNRDGDAADPYLVIHPSDGTAPRLIPYASLRGLAFTGRDTAEGRSWETWVKKHRARLEARARGEEVGPIGLFPDPID